MDSDDSVNDWSSGNEPQRNVASAPSQPIRGAMPPQRSGLRPARKTLPFVPYEDWVPGQSYERTPSCLHALYHGMEVGAEQENSRESNRR